MKTSLQRPRTFVLLISLMAVLITGCGGTTPTPVQPTVAPPATARPTTVALAPTTAPPTEAPYAPIIDPANFVTGINHPYLPLTPGVTRTYQIEIAEGTERIEVTTLGETRVIMGVTTMVVRDTAYLEGQVIEATFDWFAQDKDGNV